MNVLDKEKESNTPMFDPLFETGGISQRQSRNTVF